MKVKIKSCKSQYYWYSKYIGIIVDVKPQTVELENGDFDYVMKKQIDGFRNILVSDCVKLDREKKLKRILCQK